MAFKWQGWENIATSDPFIHWSLHGPGEDPLVENSTRTTGDDFLRLVPVMPIDRSPPPFTGEPPTDRLLDLDASANGPTVTAPADPWFLFAGLKDQIPIPEPAVNRTDSEPGGAAKEIKVERPCPSYLPGSDPANETPIREDTIIAGVIDVGIPLGHRRLRFADGKTRLLAAWQMIGDWDLNVKETTKARTIPFGCEFYENELNGLLTLHSGGSYDGWLDEQALHTATGVLSLGRAIRQTDAMLHASHGAHVLDTVAGVDPISDKDFAERVRVIAVNAPSSATFGASGTYLDNYMFHAIQRIVDIADGIWMKLRADNQPVPKNGYPIVINLSFGKQAGAKDEMDIFASELARFVCDRERAGGSRVEFIMPAGNDNLTRCNAFLEPVPDGSKSEVLGWRIPPQDQSSNFAEIWINDDGGSPVDAHLDFAPPGGTEPLPPLKNLAEDRTMYIDLKDDTNIVARVYAQRHIRTEFKCVPPKNAPAGKTLRKVRYILCVTPTFRPTGDGPIAPGGRWQIALTAEPGKTCFCAASVQTDQDVSPSRAVNLRSYFDDPAYRRHDEMGRWRDSYSYPPNPAGDVANEDNVDLAGKVRRHGTMNASAAHLTVVRVGGYRANDGQPAGYSSTGRGKRDGSSRGTVLGDFRRTLHARAPTAAFPTDDGYAHWGTLAAGSADGSVAAMWGTSFAAAQASRTVIEALRSATFNHSARGTICTIAMTAERGYGTPEPALKTMIPKIGCGRAPAPTKRIPSRF